MVDQVIHEEMYHVLKETKQVYNIYFNIANSIDLFSVGAMFVAGGVHWERPVTGLKQDPGSISASHVERGGTLPHRAQHTDSHGLIVVVKRVTVVAFLKQKTPLFYPFQKQGFFSFSSTFFSNMILRSNVLYLNI